MPAIYPDSDTLGVLVLENGGEPPFAEAGFLRRLATAGRRLGLKVLAFDPGAWNGEDADVEGWVRDEDAGGWVRERRAMPALVYDRCFPDRPAAQQRYRLGLARIASATARKPMLLGSRLPDKARVLAVLAGEPSLLPLLPPTERYRGAAALAAWLDRQGGSAFMKPACGSQGRRTAACSPDPGGGYLLSGRRRDNRLFRVRCGSREEAVRRLSRWVGDRAYLQQRLLALHDPDGVPVDLRALVQKDGTRRWRLTGVAARRGRPGSVTANLHGGGAAQPAEPLLADWFGPARAGRLMHEIQAACRQIVRTLEQHFGRFAELGLDFGVDRSGCLWFLEANSKPGRTAMECIGPAAAESAAARPVAYARSILSRPPGRVLHEFDHL